MFISLTVILNGVSEGREIFTLKCETKLCKVYMKSILCFIQNIFTFSFAKILVLYGFPRTSFHIGILIMYGYISHFWLYVVPFPAYANFSVCCLTVLLFDIPYIIYFLLLLKKNSNFLKKKKVYFSKFNKSVALKACQNQITFDGNFIL